MCPIPPSIRLRCSPRSSGRTPRPASASCATMTSFVCTIVLATTAVMAASAGEAPRTPRRLAIYYGIPSLVNGAAGDVERAAAVFAGYDVVVLGEGLQYDAPAHGRPSAGPVERQRTA